MATARARRWRRRGLWALGVVATLYAALWVVRCTRDYVPVPERPFLAGTRPLIVAHRPASIATGEHTAAAFDDVQGESVDVLELDLRLTRDGQVVVAHDSNLVRTHQLALIVAQSDLDVLHDALGERYPDRSADEILMTLDSVLRRYPERRLNLELKSSDPGLAEAVARLIDRYERHDDVLVVSFSSDAMDRFREASRGRVATGASAGEAARFYVCYLLEVACRPDYEVLQIPPRLRSGWPSVRLDDASFLAFAHRHGLEVHYWTVNDEGTMRRLLEAGADGIMTDRPGLAARVVGEFSESP